MFQIIMTALVMAMTASIALTPTPPNPTQTAIIETGQGDIVVELYGHVAPITVANFIAHARMGSYENGSFYRSVRPDNEREGVAPMTLIQGGHGFDGSDDAVGIDHESTTQTRLTHQRGAISMARYEVGTAATEFFIMIHDYPGLDAGPGGRNPDEAGYAVFGQVIEGMDVVERINRASTSADTAPEDFQYPQFLVEPVVIENIRIIEP